jgi:hypothetical protein
MYLGYLVIFIGNSAVLHPPHRYIHKLGTIKPVTCVSGHYPFQKYKIAGFIATSSGFNEVNFIPEKNLLPGSKTDLRDRCYDF